MYSKFKVFLLTGFFLLIATAVFAEPFWYFHTGHTIKYTRVKSNGVKWPVTMTIGAGGQIQCGRNDYYKVDEYNYDNLGETDTNYIRVTENAGYQCQDIGGTPTEIKFFEIGPEGYGWEKILDEHTVLKFQVVNQTRFGSQYVIRRRAVIDGVDQPNVFNHFYKGFGLVKETDWWVEDDNEKKPYVQARHGYRGSTLYATFADGLYVYDYDGKSTWTRIGSTPANMVAAGPNLYATWAGQGLYVWDGNVWTRISSVPASMVSANSKLYATWTGQGLYVWSGSGTWTRISSVPDKMVAAGKYLYASWAGQGLYKWDGATWTRISSVPVNIMPGTLSGQ